MFILVMVIILQFVTALYFCAQKQGLHYDEYYSYYSTNVTEGLHPSDNDWKTGEEIGNEFMVLDGERFHYGMVNLMQSYDVHPPLYYFVLHTVCSLWENAFTKWQGLSINLFFFVISIILLIRIADIVGGNNQYVTLLTTLLYGFSPAVLSGVTFIRMYMMLTALCFGALLIHLRGLDDTKRNAGNFYIPVFVTTYLGFMTHYYFIVFIFFVAAYMALYLFCRRQTRKQSFIYAGCVCAGLLLEVLTYPACLRHIFRGYRGTEAIGAFFDIQNIRDRASLFIGLLNDYLLGGFFYVLVLILTLLLISFYYMKKRSTLSDVATDKLHSHMRYMLITVTLGYFLVVMKTALTNAEEAVRYEMPIYGLAILLIVFGLYELCFELKLIKKDTVRILIATAVLLVVLGGEIVGLTQSKVLFLYKQDAESYRWAGEHRDDTIVYIYNNENQWMIWDDATELMNYNRLFFIDMNNEDEIVDTEICGTDHMYIYVCGSDAAAAQMQRLIDANPNINTVTKERELLYATVYEVK